MFSTQRRDTVGGSRSKFCVRGSSIDTRQGVRRTSKRLDAIPCRDRATTRSSLVDAPEHGCGYCSVFIQLEWASRHPQVDALLCLSCVNEARIGSRSGRVTSDDSL